MESFDEIARGGAVQFNDKTYLIVSEYCDGFFNSPCTYIIEVDEKGEMEYINYLDDLIIFDNTFIANEEYLTIFGISGTDEVLIYQFNKKMEVERWIVHTTVPNLWLFDVVEFEDKFVLSAYNFGTESSNFPRLYWLNTSDLEIDHVDVTEVHESSINDLEVDGSTLKALNFQEDDQYVRTYNSEGELIDTWKTAQSGFVRYANIALGEASKTLFGLVEERYLQSYFEDGDLDWEKNIADAFGVEEIKFNHQIKEMENGDFLLCGSLLNDNSWYGFMYKVSNKGEEIWKRLFEVDGSTSNVFKDFEVLSEDEYVFYGVSQVTSPLHWVVKTDSRGCLGEDCTSLIFPNYSELSPSDVILLPNPATDQISFLGLPKAQLYDYLIYDVMGRIVLEGATTSSTIDIESLDAGIYFVNLNSPNFKPLTKKLIVVNP